jgi:uncharacterized phage protein (TIGR01671 family)
MEKREIKFRAWDGKRFVSQNQYGIIGVCVESGDLFMASTGSCESPVNWMDNCKLMQFIGLHDKNGKEIYEGDVVEGSYFIQRSLDPDALPSIVYFEGVISFAEGCFYVKNNEGYFSFSFSYSDYEIEIIGNIYENIIHSKK